MRSNKECVRFIVLLLGIFLSLSAVAQDQELSEEEIESDQVFADSDAALAEKQELKKLLADEKKQADAEKKAAIEAKTRALQLHKHVVKENEQLTKDVRFWRGQAQKYNESRLKWQRMEEQERRNIEKIKLDRDKETSLLEQAKNAEADAQAALKAARSLYVALKKDLEKMQATRKALTENTKTLVAKMQMYKKANEKLERQIQALVPVKTIVSQRRPAASNSAISPKASAVRALNQDCNLRLGPSSKAEVAKIMRKGEKVLVHRLEGAWYVVGTKEFDKAFVAKVCL